MVAGEVPKYNHTANFGHQENLEHPRFDRLNWFIANRIAAIQTQVLYQEPHASASITLIFLTNVFCRCAELRPYAALRKVSVAGCANSQTRFINFGPP